MQGRLAQRAILRAGRWKGMHAIGEARKKERKEKRKKGEKEIGLKNKGSIFFSQQRDERNAGRGEESEVCSLTHLENSTKYRGTFQMFASMRACVYQKNVYVRVALKT